MVLYGITFSNNPSDNIFRPIAVKINRTATPENEKYKRLIPR